MDRAGLSKRTLEILHQAGWSEDRQVDISAYEEALQNEGFTVFPVVRAFLMEFGGLRAVVPSRVDPRRPYELFNFDAKRAAEGRDSGWTSEDYSPRVGAALCPIGEAHNQHEILVMDPAGRVFGGMDDWLVKFGESGLDAIEALCTERRGEKIP